MDYAVQYGPTLGFCWPCANHGYLGGRHMNPVVETNEFRLRFVNDVGDESVILAHRRHRCKACATRQKEIDAELKKQDIDAGTQADLVSERKTLTPRFSSIDERVLAHIKEHFPAVYAEFPFVLAHKSAITKSLNRLICNLEETTTSHGLERVFDTLRNTEHTQALINYVAACEHSYTTAKDQYQKYRTATLALPLVAGQTADVVPSTPGPVLTEPPARPRGKLSDSQISMYIAQHAAAVLVISFVIILVVT